MKVLILGSGGREHALAWRLGQDSSTTEIHVWPGNPGMEMMSGEVREKLRLHKNIFNKKNFRDFVTEENIDLVVPGAEKFLYEGVADMCREMKVACMGPTKAAARLEESKIFSKGVMTDAGIPTARFRDITRAFREDIEMAFEVLKGFKKPVIKISGPALGKGVFVCDSHAEAVDALLQIKRNPMAGLEDGIFVEEGVKGKEISLFYACSEHRFLFLGAAQDHKRLLDQDMGPNTGGMGAISPVAWADQKFIDNVTEKFVVPTLREMSSRGTPFGGILFLGLMVDGENVNLLEYNVRFGDPETQTILPLIDGDLTKALYELATNRNPSAIKLKNEVAVHIVKAARGYPGLFGETVERGQKISSKILADAHTQFFFAGVKKEGDELVTDGGRVLGVTTWEKNKDLARTLAYKKIHELTFSGEQYRHDIGAKE
jgi:phosphoribosylamine--glycine ligase